MITYRSIIIFMLILFLSGCSHKHLRVIWKAEHSYPLSYRRIMVAVIVKEQADTIRPAVERSITTELNRRGYHAVAASDEFGKNGLRNLSEENTYRELCDREIDAVLILAMIEKNMKKADRRKMLNEYTGVYYYDRIWHYQQMQEGLCNIDGPGSCLYEWESILFDLRELRPKYVLQTQNYRPAAGTASIQAVSKAVLKKIFGKNGTAAKN
ncbi:MAG: hypothetical protein KA821_18575 [Chitinophagaceae bacterium]|nr:hypothetical protein [Chitinophagaceae bacterium]